MKQKRIKLFIIIIIISLIATLLYILNIDNAIPYFSLQKRKQFAMINDTGYEITYTESKRVSSTKFLKNQEGRTGNDAWKITATEYDDAMYILTIKGLDPNEFYDISAYAKVENISGTENPAYGANIGSNGQWESSQHITKDCDWTKLDVVIRSNNDGIIKLNLRLGFWYGTTKGSVTFDDLEIEKITESSSTRKIIKSSDGDVRLLLNMSDYKKSGISYENAVSWANNLSDTRRKYAELVGKDAYNGKVDIIATNYYSAAWAFAGDPIQWMKGYQVSSLKSINTTGEWVFGILHEIGHTYDLDGRWKFDSEMWANTKMVYPLEKLNGMVIMNGKEYRGAEIKEYYKKYYNSSGLTVGDGITYKLIDIKDTITQKTGVDGWEAYKKVFRYFNELPSNKVPNTSIKKFELFIRKLSDFSGINVIEEFTQEEWKQLVEHYKGKVSESIEVDKYEVEIEQGNQSQITATVTPTDAICANLIWSSQDESIATVDENGNITAISPGVTKIVVTTEDQLCKKEIQVTVNADLIAPEIQVTPEQCEKCEKISVKVTIIEEGSGLNSNKIEYIFSKSNKVPTAEYNTAILDGTNTVTLQSPEGAYGTYYLYIKSVEDKAGNKSEDIRKGPYVLKAKVTGISIEEEGVTLMGAGDINLKVGNSKRFIINIEPEEAIASELNYTHSENLSVKDLGIEDGNRVFEVTGLKAGKAVFEVSNIEKTVSSSCNVNVIEPPVIEKQVETKIEKYKNEQVRMYIETAHSEAEITYKWYKANSQNVDGIKIDGQESSEYIIDELTLDDEGYYYCIAKNLAGETKSKIIQLTVKQPTTGVKLNKEELELKVGDKEKIIATVLPENATNKNVEWKSSNTKVVTVDQEGNVTAVGKGETTITVKTKDGGHTATCKVTVKQPVTGVILNKEELELEVGDKETIIATVLPENATNKNVEWKSSNTKVVTIDQEGNVTAVGKGETTITVKTKDGGHTATCKVTVKVPFIKITGVRLDKEELELKVGDKEKIIATVLPENATNKNVEWKSSNTKVVTIDQEGNVTAVGKGETTITVKTKDGGHTATCKVTVKVPFIKVTGVRLDKEELELKVGETETITATALPENATNKNVTYKSSNETIAIIKNGVITAVTAGETTITATTEDGGYAAICKITVEDVEEPIPEIKVTGISIMPKTLELKVNESSQLTMSISPENATNKNITWTSNDKNIAIVENGIITAVGEGDTIITVTTEDGGYTAKCKVVVTNIKEEEKDTTEDLNNSNNNNTPEEQEKVEQDMMNIVEKDKTTATTKIPQTGKGHILLIVIGILLINVIALSIYHKKVEY